MRFPLAPLRYPSGGGFRCRHGLSGCCSGSSRDDNKTLTPQLMMHRQLALVRKRRKVGPLGEGIEEQQRDSRCHSSLPAPPSPQRACQLCLRYVSYSDAQGRIDPEIESMLPPSLARTRPPGKPCSLQVDIRFLRQYPDTSTELNSTVGWHEQI